MIFLCVWRTRNEKVTLLADYPLMLFMFGLATGRLINLFLDGMVNWLLKVYMILEFGFGFAAFAFIKKILF